MPNQETSQPKPNLQIITDDNVQLWAALEEAPGCLPGLRDLACMAVIASTMPLRRATEYYYERKDFREQL